MALGRSLLLIAACAAVGAPSPAHAQRKVRIAVLEIRPLSTEAQKAELLSEVALTEAASLPGFEVIGKSDINAIIGFEKQRQVMGCGDDSSCLAEIGGALGVDFIMVGSLGTLGDLFRLDLKLVDSKRAKVRARLGVTVEGKESKLVAAIQKAVRDLLIPETPRESPPVAKKVEPAKDTPALEKKTEAKLDAPLPRPAGVVPIPPSDAGRAGVSAEATSSRRTWAYVTGGAGLALLAGGAVAGLQAKSAFDKEKTAKTVAEYDSNKSKAKSMSTVADALFLGGAAGVGVGTWLFFTSRPGALALDVAPVPGGAFASISGGF